MLKVPLEIGFHNCDSSEFAEQEIREEVAKLERLFDGLTSCRVRVERRVKTSTVGAPAVVRIELGLPGPHDIVVSHEPEHLQRKFQDPNIRTAIHEAFQIARRQLVDAKQRMQEHRPG